MKLGLVLVGLISVAFGDIATFVRTGFDFSDPEYFVDCTNGCSFNLKVKAQNVTINNKLGEAVAEVITRTYCYDNPNTTDDESDSCHYIGPTIVTKPGNWVNITLINELHGVGRETVLTPGAPFEKYHDPDVTNIHTHGLHVDSHVDDITRWASPLCPLGAFTNVWNISDITYPLEYDIDSSNWNFTGLDCWVNQTATPDVVNTIDYYYWIPPHHYPGSHWYHAHWHGATTLHVVNGLYGAWIIQDNDEAYQPKMIEVVLLISYAWLHPYQKCVEFLEVTNGCMSGIGDDNKTTLIYQRPFDGTAKPLQFPIASACLIYCKYTNYSNGSQVNFPVNIKGGGSFLTNQLAVSDAPYFVRNISIPKEFDYVEGWLVNGQFKPGIKMMLNATYHLRITATVQNYLLFSPSKKALQDCEFYVMGRDGIYFEDGPRNLNSSIYKNGEHQFVVIQPGSRADISVKCYNEGNYSIIARNLSANPVPRYLENAPTMRDAVELLSLVVSGTNTDAGYDGTHNIRPHSTTPYLRSTLNDEVSVPFCKQYPNATKLIERNIEKTFLATTDDMTQCNLVFERTGFPFGQVAMNNVQFNPSTFLNQVCFSTENDSSTAHEWLVTSNFHPFHHHTWPFQLQHDVLNGRFAKRGDWRDTMGAPFSIIMRSNYLDTFYIGATDPYPDDNSFSWQKLVMHCHFVPHEDHGMMQLVFVNHTCGLNEDYFIPPSSALNPSPPSATPNMPSPTNGSSPTTSPTDSTSVPTMSPSEQCSVTTERQATVFLIDTETNLEVAISLLVRLDCTVDISIAIKPRSLNIGNMWFSFGGNGATISSDKCSLETGNSTFPYNAYPMFGRVVVFSIYATPGGNSLNQTEVGEYQIFGFVDGKDDLTRASFLRKSHTSCNSIQRIDDYILLNCTRNFTGFPSNKDPFNTILDSDVNFIYAWGEGVFQPNKTMHSVRGGCDFCFSDVSSLTEFIVECQRAGANPVNRFVRENTIFVAPTTSPVAPTNVVVNKASIHNTSFLYVFIILYFYVFIM